MSQTMPLSGLCAHRGCHPKFPENTVPAFEEAARLGAPMVEFDVQMTRDGALVILHDADVGRTTDGSGLLREMSLASVRNLSIKTADGQPTGLRIPTLEEALQCLPRHLWINCQIKENDAETGERVARALKETGRLDQTFLACQNLAAQGARTAVPEVLVCNMDRKPTLAEYIETTLESRSSFIQITRKYTFEREDLLPLKERGGQDQLLPRQGSRRTAGAFCEGG